MNDLKLKDSKSNVFSKFEGNAVSTSYRFFVKVSLFHPPLCCTVSCVASLLCR